VEGKWERLVEDSGMLFGIGREIEVIELVESCRVIQQASEDRVIVLS
jgi:hypothetical protein